MQKRISVVLSFILTLILFLSILCIVTSANDSDFYNLEIFESSNETNYTLTLSGKISADTYTFRYEDAEGVLSGFDNICEFEVLEDTDEISYNGLILQNCAPESAEYVGVYNSEGVRVAFSDVDNLSSNIVGDKLYSFAAISDTHIGAKTADSDLINALTYFENDVDIKFTTICGDLSLAGTETNLDLYKSIVDTYTTKPVFAISGNHETNASFAPLAMDSLQAYTEQDLYYSFTYNNDVYIMMGMYSSYDNAEFAQGELQWLYETLEANRNKRCFLFMHLFPRDGSGDAVDLDLEGDMLNNTQGQVFYSLLSHYSNVIYMHGHSHQKFEIQEVNSMNTYDNVFGCHSIHIPSLAYPKYISNSKLVSDYSASEGYIVDVYEDCIVLRGRDFVSGKYLPIAQYSLDTTVQEIEENTYYDSTGIIYNCNSNVLKDGQSWYSSSFDKNDITKISFVNNYISTDYDECWDATISNSGQVMVYRNGSELVIVGNENGILANKDSSQFFCDFKNLESIVGLENLNTSNITTIDSMFKNCYALKNVNLSALNNISFEQLNYVFSGCKSLEYIDISDWDLSNVKKYNGMFLDCLSLKNVVLSDNSSLKHESVYCSNMFKNCHSLMSFDFSVFDGKNVYLGSMFAGCESLLSIDLNNITPLSTAYTFLNCTNLEAVFITKTFTTIDKYFLGNCPSIRYVFFSGTIEEWSTVTIDDSNAVITNLIVHCNSVGCTYGESIIDLEPTCTEDGSKHIECTVCGETLETITIEKLGHVSSDWITDLEPTCTEDGSKHIECTVCGETLETEILEKLGHVSSDWITDLEPTCTADGSKHIECIVCGETLETETIEKLGHTSSDWITDLEPTCIEDGSKYTECTVCGETLETEIVERLGHDYSNEYTVDVEPTCYTDGSKSRHCTRCDSQIDSTVVPATNHIDKCYCYEYEVVSETDKTIKITKYLGKEAKVEIPAIIDGYTVVAIGKSAFAENSTIISVEIPDTVKTICKNAFFLCYNLANVILPNGLTTIEYSAFSYCTGLINIEIPDSVTEIGESAFSYCSSLETINIPSEITYIRKNTFRSCVELTRIIVPDKVEIIDEYAFGYCSSLIDIWLPTSIDVLCENAFSYSNAFSTVYYAGTETEWNNITIDKNQLNHSVQIHYNVSVEGIDSHWQEYSIDATCTVDGEYGYECPCGYKESTGIPALEHEFNEEFTIDKEPTYDETGSKSRHCSRCDEVTDVTEIPMLEALKNGWINENSKWAYYEDGVKVTNRWLMDSVGWCYVGADGYCVTNCWKADSKGWCYLGADGRMVTNMWVKDSVGWCYVGADGYCVTNKWMKDSKGWVYLDANGRMATNQWIKDTVGWCYVGADGYCLTNAWAKDSVGWCYLDANGRMVYSKWIQYNNQWYYLDENGYMVTGTKVINGKTYKFNSSGVWIA